jgi:hypothetical protein
MSETDRAALLAYVQHKPKCDSFHCGCEHCYPDVKHLPPGVYVHTYQPRSCDCGLDVLLTTLESSDQTPALRARIETLESELRNIAEAKPYAWDKECRDQFREWAQNRARHALLSSSPAERTET